MTDLLDRLMKADGSDEGTRWYRNPDGPEAAREIERLQNKLNADSQNFQIECQKAEIEMLRTTLAETEQEANFLRADLAEAEALLRDIS